MSQRRLAAVVHHAFLWGQLSCYLFYLLLLCQQLYTCLCGSITLSVYWRTQHQIMWDMVLCNPIMARWGSFLNHKFDSLILLYRHSTVMSYNSSFFVLCISFECLERLLIKTDKFISWKIVSKILCSDHKYSNISHPWCASAHQR